ncbi:Sec-independent protein translocase protein TatB [Fretibacter rubidus]|uniref:Sec-independent protein translocase protein TatB n=1 Tax=Fretibacter rubidus TaxID=570162 RepID=UPI00352B7525
MLPQIGFAEMLVLALIAIIVVGPKDLPVMMRKMGAAMAKVRAMGQEFKDAFADMEAETEMAELRKEIAALKDMGKLENLSDEAFAEDMRSLDDDIRSATEMSNPKTPDTPTETPKPDSAS